MDETQPIKMSEAIQRMRDLTELNIPFAFSFITYNSSKGSTNGLKNVFKALLRKGYRDDQSKKSNILIAYYDYDDNTTEKQFYLPLLMTLNGLIIKP